MIVYAFIQNYFILFFLVTWLKFQKHPKLDDKIVCSLFFYERSHSITLSFERNRLGLMSKRQQCLCTYILHQGRIHEFLMGGGGGGRKLY